MLTKERRTRQAWMAEAGSSAKLSNFRWESTLFMELVLLAVTVCRLYRYVFMDMPVVIRIRISNILLISVYQRAVPLMSVSSIESIVVSRRQAAE